MRLKFNLGAVMTNGSDLSGGAWTSATLTLAVTDWEGVYIGTGVAVGDSVWVDTGAFEPGTLTQYKIAALGARTASSVTVTAAFVATDHSAPDLSYCIGARAVIARPGGKDLLPVLSPGTQQMPDKFAFYLLNANAAALGLGPSATGITVTNGRVVSWTVGTDAFAAIYGAAGLTTINRNGQPYVVVTYTNGLPTAVEVA